MKLIILKFIEIIAGYISELLPFSTTETQMNLKTFDTQTTTIWLNINQKSLTNSKNKSKYGS